MRRLGQFSFLVFACCCCCLSVRADDLAVARAALRDGLWKVARQHAARASGGAAHAVELEACANEGDWGSVLKKLKEWKEPKGPLYDYYRAAARGDAEKLLVILRASGRAEALLDAQMLEADLLERAGKRAEAQKIWRQVLTQTNLTERIQVTASANLRDVALLRRAYADAVTKPYRQLAGLQLGMALLADSKTQAEGERLIRDIVRDSPDANGARDAYMALAAAQVRASRWQDAAQTYRDAVETWPELAKTHAVQNGRGWVYAKLGRREEALDAFRRAEKSAPDAEARATAALKQGDVLTEMGKADEAMALYRAVITNYPATSAAARLKDVVALRELESRARECFRKYQYADAAQHFAEIARRDPSRKAQMEYYALLCLYGQGRDGAAERKAMELAADASDPAVRADATLWLAKFLYNRGEWKTARQAFLDFVEMRPKDAGSDEAMLWAARAAFAEGDAAAAIQLVSQLAERSPSSPSRMPALLLQGEALIELSRFDEAVLVLERVALAESVNPDDRLRAQILRADALFALGADNSARYLMALEAYRSVRFGGSLSDSKRLVLAFKMARTLEKLRRMDEAIDQYYSQVVLAYREGRAKGVRYDDEARAAFSRAAFALADEFASREMGLQMRRVLELVASSDVPAADEARKRLARVNAKGRFL